MTLWNCVLYLEVLYVGLRMRVHFWCEYTPNGYQICIKNGNFFLNVSNMRSNVSQIWFCTIYVAAYLIRV